MLCIMGTIRLPAERMAEARAPMAAMIGATRAEAGCIEYAFAEDVLEPGLIRVSERWADQAALDAHAASAHMQVWRAALREIGVLGRDLALYDIANPRPL
ncbi:unnamed protein product [Acidocella sp. C78]|uniref:putative quinol monooxygenase n=1 Tax=Acidocella sp. C78 TaxID=1671486 RepID=UPI00191BA926|nr:antibiotic biosynthesis monooxygenase [Acidocella sp. C78]CAG4927172.1 unnamed protein product [Acidocella sp. C78]